VREERGRRKEDASYWAGTKSHFTLKRAKTIPATISPFFKDAVDLFIISSQAKR